MKLQPVVLLILLHISLALGYLILIFLRKTSLRKEYIIPVILVPIAGPAMILTIAIMNVLEKQGTMPLPFESVEPEQDILWRVLKSYHENGNIVPLEEAILIDDVKIRRKFMLQTLYDDPLKYLDILMLAKNNDDVETSHYATTTISHTQREFQLAIQRLAVAIKHHPQDLVLLDNYIETLEKYIGSGLLEEHLLRNMRVVYEEVLDRKLAKVKSDKVTLIRKLRNNIDLRDYASAWQVSNTLRDQWPDDEQTWIEAVRVCVESQDHKQLAEILNEMRRIKIEWTKHGKAQVSAWVGGCLS